jgi:hypothetical protein
MYRGFGPFARTLRISMIGVVWWISVIALFRFAESDDAVFYWRPQIRLADFMKLKPRMPKEEVDKLLHTAGEHQFTDRDDAGTAWAVGFYEVEGRGTFMLFRNARLDGISESDPSVHGADMHARLQAGQIEVPPGFADASIIKTELTADWSRGPRLFDAMRRIQASLAQEDKKEQATKDEPPPNPVLVEAFRKAGAFSAKTQADFQRAYKENAVYASKFDAWKVRIGESVGQVEQLFGAPIYKEVLESDSEVRFYGPTRPPSSLVADPVACWPFMVLFHKGRAVRIVSHPLFSSQWPKKIWGNRL